jgi:hypothetical protein
MPTNTDKNDTWFQLACVKDSHNMSEPIARISHWYDNHETVLNPYTRSTWATLSQVCETESQRMLARLKVKTESRSGQPYFSEYDMFTDIKAGWLLVSKENDNHPLMNARETFYSRVWHDLTHAEIGANFEFSGESQVYRRQVQHAIQYHAAHAQGIAHALYLDIVAQVASGMTYQQFPIQKVF